MTDEIKSYDSRDVVYYNTENASSNLYTDQAGVDHAALVYADVTTKSGAKSQMNISWVVNTDLYKALNDQLATKSIGSTTQAQYVLNNTNGIKDEIESVTGTTITNANIGTYIFTNADNTDFIWITPLDTEPTWYVLHYYAVMDDLTTGCKNGANMWYTEIGGRPSGVGFDNPYKKVMEASKHNYGIYEDGNGNFYVDWEIEVTIPKGSAFEDIRLEDIMPDYIYKGTSTSTKANSESYPNWFTYDDLDITRYGNNDYQYQWDVSDQIFTASTDSTDPAIQALVDDIKGVMTNTYSYNFYYNQKYTGNRAGTTYTIDQSYVNTAFALGDHAQYGNFNPNARTSSGKVSPGTKASPKVFSFLLKTLPVSTEDYTIKINYTTQINPDLIDDLPQILSDSNQDYIVQKNTLNVWQCLKTSSGSLARGSQLFSTSTSYYIGKKDLDDTVEKEVLYDADKNLANYTVDINDKSNVEAENVEYQLKDVISYSGIPYKSGTFTLKTEDGDIVWTDVAGSTAAAKYDGYADVTVSNSDDSSSSFTINLDNTTGVFTEADGQLTHLILTYSTDVSTWVENDPLQNTVSLKYTETDATGQQKDMYIGDATASLTDEMALRKTMSETPSYINDYRGTFEIFANLDSPNCTADLRNLKAGDTFTLDDDLASCLDVDVSSIKLYGYNETTKQYDAIDVSKYEAAYDEDLQSLAVIVSSLEKS